MTDDPWLKTSIMATRGLAKGQAGKRHELTIEKQGPFHYVYGPYAKPVLTIDPGDIVAVETEDAFGGVITSEKDSPTAKLKFPSSIRNAADCRQRIEKGDCLAVHIHCGRDQGRAAGRQDLHSFRNSAAWSARLQTALLNPPLPERVRVNARRQGRRALERQDHAAVPAVHWNHRNFPRDRGDLIAAADYHGGNMDLPECRARRGSVFPRAYQRRFSLCRRLSCRPGRRRIIGVAIEQRATADDADRRHQGLELCLARLETRDFLMTIGSARPLEDAARIAYRELVRWMSADYGFDEIDAYMLLSQAGRIRLGNMVDPKYTMGAGQAAAPRGTGK